MIVTNFSRFDVLDAETNKLIMPPKGLSFDYADSDENLVAFKSNQTVNIELFNSYENKNYNLNVPVSYKVIRRKIKFERN